MRHLTFKGYLLSQLRALSEYDGTSFYMFSRLALNNARLKNTLVLYLAIYTKSELRNRLLKKFDYIENAYFHIKELNEDNFDDYLSGACRSEYKTIYDNYLSVRNQGVQENKIKLMMHKKIIELKTEKKITNYRIYNDLHLNRGNVNAFLKYADTSKVSIDTVRNILAFANSY